MMFFFCDVSHQLLFANLQKWSLTGSLQMMFVGLDTLKKTKSLFWCHCIVHVYSTYVCNMHSIHEGDKPTRQETRPLQASSLCGVNVLKLRLPSTFF